MKLPHILQTGATGIVTALHQIPIGTKWEPSEIGQRKDEIERHGLRWSVVESLPIHEDIKTQSGAFKEYIENYKYSLRSLAQQGINTVCYNVMPVLDWTRTDLSYSVKDGSTALSFDWITLCAFDLYILQRKNAEVDYSEQVIAQAKDWFNQTSPSERTKLVQTMLAGLPGSDQGFDMEHFKSAIQRYQNLSSDTYVQHLKYFLEQIIPVAQEHGVKMCVHPDDPPFNILGLPRVLRTGAQVDQYLGLIDSVNHGLTLCTGSLGAEPDNDLATIAANHRHRIHFVHLRNVTNYGYKSFFEENHLEGAVDMSSVLKVLLKTSEENQTLIPFRPDHGHLLAADCEPF